MTCRGIVKPQAIQTVQRDFIAIRMTLAHRGVVGGKFRTGIVITTVQIFKYLKGNALC